MSSLFIFCNIRKKYSAKNESPALFSAGVSMKKYYSIGFKCFNDKSRIGALCVSAPEEI